MNAARLLPRTHGISTVVCSAVAITDLIKRLFIVVLFWFFCSVRLRGRLPLVEHQIVRPIGRVWGELDKKSEKQNFSLLQF